MVFAVPIFSEGFGNHINGSNVSSARKSRVLSNFFDQVGQRMHLVEITILSLNDVTVRPNKVMNRAYKNWAHL